MMTTKDSEAMLVRSNAHDALSVFLGKWRAEGMSFGGFDQMGADPKANGAPWVSTHNTHCHTGDFFLIQNERARTVLNAHCAKLLHGVMKSRHQRRAGGSPKARSSSFVRSETLNSALPPKAGRRGTGTARRK